MSTAAFPTASLTPAITFSSTVSDGTSLPAWKVRRMPRLAIRSARIPVMSRSPRLTVPPSGLRWPVTQLNSVVLPDPFGPMMPWMAPAATSMLTESRARNAPKDLLKRRDLQHGSFPA